VAQLPRSARIPVPVLPRGTYSIVGADPSTGEVGAAVQSRYFAVGALVPWARAGVGAVATQALGVAAYGPRILKLLADEVAPAEAIERALADDALRERRQLGVVAANGRSASRTGSECLDWAGDAQGAGWAAQGNILAGPDVVRAMGEAFESTTGDLTEKLMRALEAAEAAGGDRRGRQSAALVLERRGAAAESSDGIDRVVDLRVDDHPEPIEELRRLVGLRRGQLASAEAFRLSEQGDPRAAADRLAAHVAGGLSAPEEWYNLACFEALAGRRDAAFDHLEEALGRDAGLKTLAADDPDLDSLRDDPRFARLLG
jgi:uncharacterized Ntn-hydrolase superfamily protein